MVSEITYSEKYLEHDTGPNHPEKPERVGKSIKRIRNSAFIKKLEISEPYAANIQDLELAHTKSYIKKIKDISEKGGGLLTSDTPINRNTFEIASLAAGGTVKTTMDVFEGKFENGFALVRPPGHHATSNGGGGFCYFNNIAIATESLLKKDQINKALIFDFDAHHGNGTQEIFYSTNSVLYISFHQNGRTLYPGTGFPKEIGSEEGEGYTVNVPFNPGSKDENYAAALNELFVPLCNQFKPDMILVSVGLDAHKNDPLTNIELSTSAFGWLSKRSIEQAKKLCGDKIIFTLEGGYSIEASSDSILEIAKAMTGEKVDDIPEGTPTPFFKDVKKALGPYWDL